MAAVAPPEVLGGSRPAVHMAAVAPPQGLDGLQLPSQVLDENEPPLQRGELVLFGDGRRGQVTRSYLLEDKYAIKAEGALREVKGPNNNFFYFRRRDLHRAVPLNQHSSEGEPAAKHARLDPANGGDASPPAREPAGPPRFKGYVKWFVKEKGFGKIVPMSVGQPAEEIFLHKKAMDGGADGPHTQAVGEGSQVTYELMASPVDGKPCACKVQVMGVKSSLPPDNESRAQKEVLIRKLLENGMQVGIHQDKGVGKASMEDRMICRPGITVDALGATCKKVVCSLFGVFDGHSGASCSEFVSNHLDRYLFDSFRHQKRDGVAGDMAMRSALQAAFRTTEHNFFQYANKLDAGPAMAWSTAGSTACTCTLFGPDEEGRLRLATANAGDSRAVLGRKDGRAIRLSEDHTPEVPTERKRIEQAGSSIVNCSGIWRIVLPSRKGTGVAGLSVSRGFGDLEYKQGAAVVSAVPDVFLRTIDLRVDTFVIIASDGVWGPISDTEAVRIVSVALREGGEDPAKAAAQSLLEKAHLLDGHDDKTVIVIWFGDVPDEPPKVTVAPGPVTYMRPVSVKPVANDMFEEKRPKPDLGQQMSELDNLFASYARDIG